MCILLWMVICRMDEFMVQFMHQWSAYFSQKLQLSGHMVVIFGIRAGAFERRVQLINKFEFNLLSYGECVAVCM